MLELDIDTSGFDRFIDRLDAATDPSVSGPVQDGLYAASDVYMESQRERFSQYSNRGGDWAEHAPSTIRKRGAGAPILNEKGDLEASLERGAANHVLETTADGVREGTADPKARFHQDGTEKMPARRIISEPGPDTLAEMKKPLAEGIQGAVREAGR